MEGELGEKKFFRGNTFGFVDIALVPFVAWFYTYETWAKFSIMEKCPKIVAWANRCMERESVSKTLCDPKKIYEFVLTFEERFGLK